MVYISKQQIMTRFKRYKELNQTRLSHALSLMSADARYCLSIVPVLLHYNHINLPGFRANNVPQGIDMFEPDALQQHYLQSLISPQACALEEPKHRDILGLYAMGSTSSLGQSDSSDVDIWVCVKANLSAERTIALQDKCRFITNYIKSQGVELNLFVTPEDRFTNFQPDSLDEENCGSAQNLFLLDEFYRSSIRLCGRYIIWYLISTKEEQQSYQDYVRFLTQGISGMEQFIVPKDQKSQPMSKAKLSLGASLLRSVCPLMANHFVFVCGCAHAPNHLWFTEPWSPFTKDRHNKELDPDSELLKSSGAMDLAYPLSTQVLFAYPIVTNSFMGNSLVPKLNPINAPTLLDLEKINNVAFAESQLTFEIEEYFKQQGVPHYQGFYSLKDWMGQIRSEDFSSGYISNYDWSVSYAVAKYQEQIQSDSSYVGLTPQYQALLHSEDMATPEHKQRFTLKSEQDSYVFLLNKRAPESSWDSLKEDSEPFSLDNPYSAFEDSNNQSQSTKIDYLSFEEQNNSSSGLESIDEEENFDTHIEFYDTDYDLLSLGGTLKNDLEFDLDREVFETKDKTPIRHKRRNRVAKKASVRMVRVARSLAKSTSFNLSLQKLFPAPATVDSNKQSLGPNRNQSLSSPYAQDLITGSLDGNAVSLSLDDSILDQKHNRPVKVAGFERFAAAMGVTPMPFLMPLDPNVLSESSEDLDHYVDGKKKLLEQNENYPEWAYGRILSDQECIQAASHDDFHEGEAPLDSSEWFDFGSVVKNSPTEYFGSGLWLLYKAIESPFKVVLKILLMEAYSNDYPHNRLLSSELKDYMLSHDGYSLDLDSYYLMYLKVSNYLQSIKHDSRLLLMRKCFYLKIFMGLNNKSAYHRADYKLKRGLLNKFSVRWGWSKDFVYELEQVDSWKMEQVRSFNKEVYNTLLESYQSLLRFSVRHGIEYAITSDDAGILSRKLYAAFDRFPGKVIVMHSSFSHNLEERDLTFICPSPSSLCKKGWHLYSAASDDVALLNLKVSYIGSRLSEVVTWACFNGLLSARTTTYVTGAPSVVSPFKIKKLSSDIMRVLAPKRGRVSEQSLQRSVKMTACLVVLNLEKDDTELLQNNLVDIDYSSTLCYGRSRSCLIGSIDLIVLNSWGELRSIALPNGEEGVVELLATLLRIMSADEENIDSVQSMLDLIEVCSYAASYQDLIKYDLEATIRQIFSCLTTTGSSEYVFEVGRNTYIARAQKDRGVMINKKSVFGSSEFDISVLSRYGMRPEYALQVPPLVDRYATSGIVQYFFCPLNLDKGHWDIYIVNERNEVNIYHNYFGSRATLVNAINRFYTNQSQNRSQNSVRFNLPQYFVLNSTLDAIHPFTIRHHADESSADCS